MKRRWIRLDVLWEESEWLHELDGTASGCWPRLLCMVKRDGVAGECRRPSTRRLSEMWRVPATAIQSLESAAIVAGALKIEDGGWVVVKWAEYQDYDPTNAERQRRFRAKHGNASSLKVVNGDL